MTEDPYREDDRECHRFRHCAKCGCTSVEALWQDVDPSEKIRWCNWWYVPSAPVGAHGRIYEGFFVRCRQCSYAWYELLNETNDPTEQASTDKSRK